MELLLSAFKRHEMFFRNENTKELCIPFFKPVSRNSLKKAFCLFCRGSRVGG